MPFLPLIGITFHFSENQNLYFEIMEPLKVKHGATGLNIVLSKTPEAFEADLKSQKGFGHNPSQPPKSVDNTSSGANATSLKETQPLKNTQEASELEEVQNDAQTPVKPELETETLNEINAEGTQIERNHGVSGTLLLDENKTLKFGFIRNLVEEIFKKRESKFAQLESGFKQSISSLDEKDKILTKEIKLEYVEGFVVTIPNLWLLKTICILWGLDDLEKKYKSVVTLYRQWESNNRSLFFVFNMYTSPILTFIIVSNLTLISNMRYSTFCEISESLEVEKGLRYNLIHGFFLIFVFITVYSPLNLKKEAEFSFNYTERGVNNTKILICFNGQMLTAACTLFGLNKQYENQLLVLNYEYVKNFRKSIYFNPNGKQGHLNNLSTFLNQWVNLNKSNVKALASLSNLYVSFLYYLNLYLMKSGVPFATQGYFRFLQNKYDKKMKEKGPHNKEEYKKTQETLFNMSELEKSLVNPLVQYSNLVTSDDVFNKARLIAKKFLQEETNRLHEGVKIV